MTNKEQLEKILSKYEVDSIDFEKEDEDENNEEEKTK